MGDDLQVIARQRLAGYPELSGPVRSETESLGSLFDGRNALPVRVVQARKASRVVCEQMPGGAERLITGPSVNDQSWQQRLRRTTCFDVIDGDRGRGDGG